ncbi:hypothetical protein CYMTET_43369 [Cymbomonas tetramitiformis]|uniref:Uncharacterized protein n=1 Tax=Cymbomonas tetramitiformis TaxID=36881 RepID=A0AAE0C3N0_9CHLO|nr:hypothetical protein CYMTET_43369 [Cymbomonas tetramitiformis]
MHNVWRAAYTFNSVDPHTEDPGDDVRTVRVHDMNWEVVHRGTLFKDQQDIDNVTNTTDPAQLSKIDLSWAKRSVVQKHRDNPLHEKYRNHVWIAFLLQEETEQSHEIAHYMTQNFYKQYYKARHVKTGGKMDWKQPNFPPEERHPLIDPRVYESQQKHPNNKPQAPSQLKPAVRTTIPATIKISKQPSSAGAKGKASSSNAALTMFAKPTPSNATGDTNCGGSTKTFCSHLIGNRACTDNALVNLSLLNEALLYNDKILQSEPLRSNTTVPIPVSDRIQFYLKDGDRVDNFAALATFDALDAKTTSDPLAAADLPLAKRKAACSTAPDARDALLVHDNINASNKCARLLDQHSTAPPKTVSVILRDLAMVRQTQENHTAALMKMSEIMQSLQTHMQALSNGGLQSRTVFSFDVPSTSATERSNSGL